MSRGSERRPEHRTVTRRKVLKTAGAGLLAVAGGGLLPGNAAAANAAAKVFVDRLTGGKAPARGRIRLELPQIAENGNSVPLSVAVDSPMTATDYVKAIHIIADDNPQPDVAVFKLSPAAGRAEIATRIRLARTQNVMALAEMSDGTFHMEKAEVKVTIGGCGG